MMNTVCSASGDVVTRDGSATARASRATASSWRSEQRPTGAAAATARRPTPAGPPCATGTSRTTVRGSRRGRRMCSSTTGTARASSPSAAGLANVTPPPAGRIGAAASRVLPPVRVEVIAGGRRRARRRGGAARSARRRGRGRTRRPPAGPGGDVVEPRRGRRFVGADLIGGERHGDDLAGLGVDEVEVAGEVGVQLVVRSSTWTTVTSPPRAGRRGRARRPTRA